MAALVTASGWLVLGALTVVVVLLGRALEHVLGGATAERVEATFLRVAAGIAVLSWWGVVLAEAEMFTPAIWLGTPAVLIAACGFLPRARAESSSLPPWLDFRALAAVLAVIVAGTLLYFPTFDVRLEARDPGVYAHTGEQLARTGALAWHDESVTELPAHMRSFLFPGLDPRHAHDWSRYMGFYLEDAATGRVVPQALPVYPVWAAAGYWVASSPGSLAAAALFMVLAACGLCLLGRVMFGTPGLLAGVLLATDVAIGWFARYSAAEAAAAFLIVTGTLALLRYRAEGQPFHGVMAAMTLGLCPMTKAELTPVAAVLAVILVLDVARGRLRRQDLFVLWLPLAALGLHTVVHARGWAWPYYVDVLSQFRLTTAKLMLPLGGGAAAFCLGLMVVRWATRSRARQIDTFVRGGSTAGRLMRVAATLLLGAGMAYGYWGRPYFYLRDGGDSWNMANFLELGLTVSGWAILLAFAGMAAVLLGKHSPGRVAAVFLLGAVGGMVMWERSIIPDLMWAYRRLLPAVLPGVYLFAVGGAAATGRLVAAGAGRLPGAGGLVAVPIALAVLIPVGWHQATEGSWLRTHVQLGGSAELIDALAAITEPDDLILFEPRTSSGLLRFEAAAGLSLERRTYRLPAPDLPASHLRTLALRQAQRGGRVLLITAGAVNGLAGARATPLEQLEWSPDLLEEVRAYTDYAETRSVRLPREVSTPAFVARIYEIEFGRDLAALPQRSVGRERRGVLDVGLWDDLYVLGGTVHGVETDGIRNFRWTKGTAGFLLPGMPADAQQVVIRIHGNDLIEDQTLTATLDGIPLGQAPVEKDWADIRFDVPTDWVPGPDGMPTLRITVQYVSQAAVDETVGDRRYLGAAVDRVFWARALPDGEG